MTTLLSASVLQPAVQGDVHDKRTLRLGGVAAFGLASFTGHVWRGGHAPVALACTIVDEDEFTIELNLGGAGGWLASAAPGQWSVEVQAHWPDGTTLTWPPAAPMTIHVRLDGDPEEE